MRSIEFRRRNGKHRERPKSPSVERSECSVAGLPVFRGSARGARSARVARASRRSSSAASGLRVMSGSGYKRLQDGNNVTDDHQQVEDGQHPLERPSLSTACTTTQHHAVRGQHHVRTSPTGASISPGFIARTSTLRSGRVPVHVSASP